jgi:hypothetical protein
MERSDYMVITANAECNEAGKGVLERQRGGVANLVLLLHNPLSIIPGEGSPYPSRALLA